jgi:hypothetical protein
LTLEIKKKILGENAARIYGIDITAKSRELGLRAPRSSAGAKKEAAVAERLEGRISV